MDKSQHHPHDTHGNFMNGVLTGAVIGGSIVFLLGTKKGRKLLKTISEEGLENMTGLGELLDGTVLDENEEAAELEPKSKEAKAISQKPEDPASVKTLGIKAKRFFRGVRRK